MRHLKQRLFILNGKSRSGKDTWAYEVKRHLAELGLDCRVQNSVQYVKDAISELLNIHVFEIEQHKEQYRDLIIQMKDLAAKYGMNQLEYLRQSNFNDVMIYVVREPEVIENIKIEFSEKYDITTIMMHRPHDYIEKHSYDEQVDNYKYDMHVNNVSGVATLRQIAREFAKQVYNEYTK